MLKGTDKSTVQSQALDKMVAEGKISIEMRNKILGGVIKSIPVRNEQGAVIGEDLVDLSNMQAIRTSAPTGGGTSPTPTAPGQGLPQPTNAPAARPGEPNPLQQGDDALLKDPKVSMALAAGIAPVVGTTAGGLAGQLGIDLGTSEMSKRQAAQAALRSALAEIARQGEGLGVSNKLLNTALDLAEFGTAMTPSIGPREANIKLRTLRQDVDDDYAAAERTMRDINQPQSVRSKAGLKLEALRNLQRSLPTVQQLDRMQAMIEAGTAGAWTPGTLMDKAKSGLQQGTDKLKGQSQQQKDFTKMDEPSLLAIDPKLLSKNERLQYMNRIQELIAAKKKAPKKPDTSTKMDGKPRI